MATGKFVIFIDGDDMIYSHGLEFMVNALEGFPECGMALMHPFMNWMFLPAVISSRDFYISNYFGKGFNSVAFANTLFNTAILNEVGGISTEYLAGDTFVRLVIAAKYSTLIIQDQLTWWRETPGQAFQRLSNSPDAGIQNIRLHLRILSSQECPLDEAERQQAINNEFSRLRRTMITYLANVKLRMLVASFVFLLNGRHFMRILFAKYHSIGVFSLFSPSNPLRMKGVFKDN